jgi:hypothetical protein
MADNHAAFESDTPNTPAVFANATSPSGAGVHAISNHAAGVEGSTNASDSSAIFGFNGARGQVPDGLNRPAGNGVWGHTTVAKGSGVVGSVEPGVTPAVGVTGIGPIAARFIGKVECDGPLDAPKSTITCFDIALAGADCAEEFEVVRVDDAQPGSVMSLDEHGLLRPSCTAYDRNVAGILSGAGEYRPGVVLDRQAGQTNRAPLALVGKTYCLVDAAFAPIQAGDLLTTSPTPGHAMKALDRERAFGAVIGKAMRPLAAGRGLIPVLIALQ